MELFKLIGSIAVDTSSANEAIDETTKKAGDSGGKMSKVLTGIGNAGKKVGSMVAGTVKVAGGAAIAVGGAAVAAANSTREYRVEMGKLTTAFQTSGHSADSAKKTYSDLESILGDSGQAVEAANHLAVLTDNQKDLDTWTNICTGVFATFGDSLPIEGLTEAANETAKVGQVTGPLADALNWAGVSEDEFNKKLATCSTEQERQKLIMDTLNKTYKDASNTYKETNKDVIESEKANQRFTNVMAKVGAMVEPVLNQLKNSFADVAEGIMPMVEQAIPMIVAGLEQLIPFVSQFAETIIPVVMSTVSQLLPVFINLATSVLPLIAQAIMAIMPTIQQLIPVITQLLTSILPVVTQILQQLLPPLMQIVQMVLPVIVQLIQALLPVLTPLFTVLQPVMTCIMTILQPLIQLITAILPPIITFIQTVATVLSAILVPVINVISNILGVILPPIISALGTVINAVVTVFTAAFNAIKTVWEALAPVFSAIWNKIKVVFGPVAAFFKKCFGAAFTAIKTVFGVLVSVFRGIWNGIKAVFSPVISFFGKIFKGAWNGIKSAFSATVGFFKTLWSSIKSVFSGVGSFFSSVFGVIGDILKAPINLIIKGLNFLINGINKISFDVPDWVPVIGGGKFGFDIPTIPELEEGGVLERGQVGLLEGNGSEAVVPLEKNTGWLDQIALRLAKLNPSSSDGESVQKLDAIITLLQEMAGTNRIEEIQKALAGTDISWNKREIGRLVKSFA